jgi:hypothetical protein
MLKIGLGSYTRHNEIIKRSSLFLIVIYTSIEDVHKNKKFQQSASEWIIGIGY